MKEYRCCKCGDEREIIKPPSRARGKIANLGRTEILFCEVCGSEEVHNQMNQ